MLEMLLFVFQYLAVELVDQRIDRGIHVGVVAFDENVLAAEMNVGFYFLLQLVYGENHVNVYDVIEMPCNARELAGDVLARTVAEIDGRDVVATLLTRRAGTESSGAT